MGKQILFVSPQIANPQKSRLIPQSLTRKFFPCVPVRKSKIHKFAMINPQIAIPQISLVSQSANRKSANVQGKKQFSDPDPHWFSSNITVYLRKYILD